MKISEILEMAPLNIDYALSSKYEDKKLNKETTKEIISSYKKVKTYKKCDIYEHANKLFGIYDNEIIYHVIYKITKIENVGLVTTQSWVWRKLDINKTIDDIVIHMFFNFLIEKHGKMMTDAQQTKQGRNFWKSVVSKALNDGLFIYVYDYYDKNNIKVEYLGTNLNDVRNKIESLYGDKPIGFMDFPVDFYKSKRIIISKTKI